MKKTYVICFILFMSLVYLPLNSLADYSESKEDNSPFQKQISQDNSNSWIYDQLNPSKISNMQNSQPTTSKSITKSSNGNERVETPRIQTTGLSNGPINLNALADDTVEYTNSYPINDVLEGQGGDPWDGETVTLHRNGSGALDSTTTAGDGTFSFTLTFTPADIGLWNYTVEFAGNLPFRKAGTIVVLLLQVVDPVTITVTVDKPNVGGSELYTYTFTAVTTSGNPIASNIAIFYQEQYSVSNGNEDSGTVILNGAGIGTYSSTYGLTDGPEWTGINQSIISLIDLNVTNKDNYPNYTFTFNTPVPTVTVTVSYNFALTTTMDGSTYNEVPKYYRADQVFNLHLNVSSFGGDTPLEVQQNVENKPFWVEVIGAGNGLNGTLDGILNSTGEAEVSFVLSYGNFPNLRLAQQTTVLIRVTVDGVNNLDDNEQEFQIKLKEDVGTFSPTTNINVNTFYYPGTASTIIVSGTLKDAQGDDAYNVPITLRIRNAIYNPANASMETITFGTQNTDSFGSFSFTITNFNFGFTLKNHLVYLNVTIGTISNSAIVQPAFPHGVTSEVGNFKHFTSLTTTFEYNFDNSSELNESPLTASLQTYLNNTLYEIATNGSYVEITVLDVFGRIPDGIQVRFIGPSGFTQTFTTLTSTNGGEFNITYATLFSNVPLSSYNVLGQEFDITLESAINGDPILLQSDITKKYRIYGPDNVAPSLISAPTVQGNNTGNADDITITVLIAGGTNAKLNIRNVTLYYRFSDALVDTNPVFSSGYSLIAMNYNSLTGQATYTFPFGGHGNWSQFFVIIYDLQGWGILDGGGIPSQPLYAADGDTLTFTTSTFRAKMGDTTIDLSWANNLPAYVYINGTSMSSGTSTNLTIGQDLRIDFYVVPDNGDVLDSGTKGYGMVVIYWKVLTYDKFGTLVFDPGIFTMSIMIQQSPPNQVSIPIAVDNTYRYQFIIEGATNFTSYFQTVDFYFEVTDIYGNTDNTSVMSNFIDNLNVFSTVVQDEVAPTSPTKSSTTSASHPPISPTQSEVWNRNETGTFSFTINDTETGIYSVILTVYYTLDGNLTPVEQLLVFNGTIFILSNNTQIAAPLNVYDTANFTNFGILVNVTTIGSGYLVDLLIDFSGIWENTTISYSATTEDFSGNIVVTNAQDGSETSFYVKNAFVPEFSNTEVSVVTTESVTTIVTTDSDGNTITIVSTSTGLATLFGLDDEDESNNAALVILIFTAIVVGITLWYQRHNIMETFARRARARKVRGTLSELTDEIKRLGAEGQYRKAILLTWEALERVSREIVQAPRSYNQTAREYASFLSTATIVDRETLLTLSNSFESAKYGKDEPSIDVWDDAIKALEITVLTIIESGARVQLDEDDEEFD